MAPPRLKTRGGPKTRRPATRTARVNGTRHGACNRPRRPRAADRHVSRGTHAQDLQRRRQATRLGGIDRVDRPAGARGSAPRRRRGRDPACGAHPPAPPEAGSGPGRGGHRARRRGVRRAVARAAACARLDRHPAGARRRAAVLSHLRRRRRSHRPLGGARTFRRSGHAAASTAARRGPRGVRARGGPAARRGVRRAGVPVSPGTRAQRSALQGVVGAHRHRRRRRLDIHGRRSANHGGGRRRRSDDLARAIDYAVDHGARVVNASWGGGGQSRAIAKAVARAGERGVLVVPAAGNDGASRPSFPANLGGDNVLSVGALAPDGRLAPFSNRGALVAAPGVGILSTTAPGQYERYDGTSMAAPHVSGLAALLWAARPQAKLEEIRRAILSSTVPVPGTRNGRIDAARAMAALLAEAGAGPAGGLMLSRGSLLFISDRKST